jgi:hypothetical protein
MKGVYSEGWKDEQMHELVFQGGVSACIRTGYRSKSVAVDDLWSFTAWLWLLCCMYYEWALFLWPVCCMSTNFVCWHLLCMIWIASLCMFICETFNNEIRFDYYLHSDSHLNAHIFLSKFTYLQAQYISHFHTIRLMLQPTNPIVRTNGKS